MQPESIKQQWQNVSSSKRTHEELKSMMLNNRHPALKKMRTQVIIETIAFCILSVFYYDMFDGERRSMRVNVLFQSATVITISLGLIGYGLAKRKIEGGNLVHSLQRRLTNIRTYAAVSVVGRLFFAVSLLIFFASVITFDTVKYWMLAGIILGFALQLFFLSRMWLGRVMQLRNTIESLSE